VRIDSVLFDVDGTLVDSNEFHIAAWHRALSELGFNIAREQIRKQMGKGSDMLLPALLPDLQKHESEALSKRHGEIFKAEYLHRVRAFPCAYELLETLHRDEREIVLASSADQAEVDYYIGLLGVKELLKATTSSDEARQSKPAGDIFASALEKTNSKLPQNAMVVGDTPYDASAAAKCRIRTIALRSGGFSDEELRGENPVAIYDNVADLFKHLSTSPLAN
jgi:membrane protein